MSYYTRILTPSTRIVSVAALQAVLDDDLLDARFAVEDGTADDWHSLVLTHKSGAEISAIERNSVDPDSLAAIEIDESLEEIAECKPASAAQWLSNYLPKVKTIYAFQWLHGTDVNNGGAILGAMMIALHKIVGGVIQADGEGFCDDEQGDQILWQFSERAKGPWRMAVLRDGKWVRFEMELSNRKHREAFLRGEVPAGVKLLE
jgi:hypothetical protein